MEQCPKCGSNEKSVFYRAEGTQMYYNLGVDGYEKFMRNDSYYQYDRVKKEHLVHTCKTCGYKVATECKKGS